MTVGRLASGFLSYRVASPSLIRAGSISVFLAVLLMLLPLPLPVALAAFVLAGLGCAPVFPSLLHVTPVRFGKENAQALMGWQMAVAYVGAAFMPPLFGVLATVTSLRLLPLVLLLYAVVLLVGSERVRNLRWQED